MRIASLAPQINTDMMMLGLDQMRKYKCIVDLERDVLVFGGTTRTRIVTRWTGLLLLAMFAKARDA